MNAVAGPRWQGVMILLSVLGGGAIMGAVWAALDTEPGPLGRLLPALAVLFASAAIAVHVWATVHSVSREPFLQTTRSRGLPTTAVVVRRVLRRSALPTVMVLGIQIAFGWAGALVVRAVLGVPGDRDDATLPLPTASLPIVVAVTMLCALALGIVIVALAPASLVPRPPTAFSPMLPSTTFRSADFLDIRDLRFALAAEVAGEHPGGISLTVPRGEALAVIGDDDSCVTTLGLAIAGLLPTGVPVWSGSILVDGRELVGLPERDLAGLRGSRIGYLPAPGARRLDPHARLGHQVLELLARRSAGSRAEVRCAALALFSRVGIVDPADVLQAYPHEVSAETAHRVLLAGALAPQPELLVAHEPTLGFDGALEAEFLDLLHDLQRDTGFTLIVSSARVELAARCDRVAVLSAGTVVEYASVGDLFTEPRHPRTRLLLAERDARAEPTAL